MIDFNDVGPQPGIERAGNPDWIDEDAMSAQLAATAPDWVPIVFPKGRKDDEGHWRVANIRGDAPRKRGSCVVFMHGQRAGGYHEFDSGDGGGPLRTLGQHHGISGADLFAKAKELAGTPRGAIRLTEGKPKRDDGPEIELNMRMWQATA